MKRAFATLIALFLAGSAAWGGEMMPSSKDQPGPPAPAPAQPSAPMTKEIEGKIKTVDRSGKGVTLEDGTKLSIPDALKASHGALREGVIVKATYHEKGEENVVTSIEVRLQEEKPKS